MSGRIGIIAGLVAMTAAAGAGMPVTAATGAGTIAPLAGTGQSGYTGDGGPALEATLDAPRTLDVAPDGTVYVADTDNHVIRRIDTDGTITTIAGTGQPGYGGDGGPATEAWITSPHGVAVDHLGNVYIADSRNHRVRRVNPNGVMSTVAGTGRSGFDGDRGPARLALLSTPKGVAVDRHGDLYIADTGNHRIRRVNSSGVIVTVAGIGEAGGSGDGGAAIDARITNPRAVAVDRQGRFSILEGTEGEIGRVRRVGADGVIELLAGTGQTGFGGDGGPATEALLNHPRDLAADAAGNVFIADSENERVRKVDTSGTITTIAGAPPGPDGNGGNDPGEGGPAAETDLSVLRGIAVGLGGDLLIADSGHHMIRTIFGVADGFPGGDPPGPPDPDPGAGGSSNNPEPPDGPEPHDGSEPRDGYWILQDDGRVHALGDAPRLVDASGALRPGSSAVDLAATPSGGGYWVLGDDGLVVAVGDAIHHGNAPPLPAGDRITSISATPTGGGYWLFSAQGRALAFGDARHHGDMAGVALNGPVLDSVATPSGQGYWMVASDGGIFSFGDARFEGSMGGHRLNAPVLSLVPDPDGAGYWLVAADGGVFSFGAPFRGSLGGVTLNQPVTAMIAYGDGYLMVAADGGIFNFSDRPFQGSLAERGLSRPVVTVAAPG